MCLPLPKAYAPIKRGYHGVVPGIAGLGQVLQNRKILNWLMEGSKLEDAGTGKVFSGGARLVNHFHDPLKE